MYFDLTDLLVLTLLVLMAAHWWGSLQIKEIALKRARQECKHLDLQLLDESVSLRALWLKRDDDGRIHFWRRYTFEFSSTGEDRYSGHIIMLGKRITDMHLEPHRMTQ